MALRVCLVSPFPWSQPGDVNEHVPAVVAALDALGHEPVVLTLSTRAGELARGRRALRRLEESGEPLSGVVALGPAVALPRGSRIGVPVGTGANLRLALARGGYDVVHAFEPAMPGIAHLALRIADTLTIATFNAPDRLGYPPGRAQREKLLARIDALTATSTEAADAAAVRFPGSYRVLPAGIDTKRFAPAAARAAFVFELSPEDRELARCAIRALRELPGYELTLVRGHALVRKPAVPRVVQGRVRILTAPDPDARAAVLRGAAGFVPAPGGSRRLRLEAAAAGVPAIEPPGLADQPELVAAAMQRLAEDETYRSATAAEARAETSAESAEALTAAIAEIYTEITARRRPAARQHDPLEDRPWILADLHMHTDHSHDCSIPVPALLDHAEAIGLGAIAVTDHNVFEGARAAVELARGRELVVIPGEEVKTDGQGEVIGLFLGEAIPRGMSMAETIAAIRAQGGLVYVPHPFDRLHSIPDAATLHRHLAEIDVFEGYNARLLFEAYNDEALRFARKYNLLVGAGSDAHVLQGVGTGCLRMRAFANAEEFLLSLRTAEVVRRPKSLLYLQGLKWVAQARERRAAAEAR